MSRVTAVDGARLLRRLLNRKATAVPSAPALDSTLAMVREGYPFIWNRCRRFKSDIFTTRILGKPAVCIHGPEAAQLFYDETKLRRNMAVPRRVVTSLFGKKAVHTLDDEAHRRRKAAFMSLMTDASIERLIALMAEQWQLAIRRWESQPTVVLFDESQRILTAAVCAWAGVPLELDDLALRARQLGDMVDAFGGVGPRLWRGKLARMAAERWIMEHVQAVRRGDLPSEPNTALDVFDRFRDERGRPLDAKTVAVEVLNVIRPTSAIAWYITDAAVALERYPETRAKLVTDDDEGTYAKLFMQEVRRFFPFTPYLGAMVRAPFEWQGHKFKVGTLVLLDVYGASQDARLWPEPNAFIPERFATHVSSAFDFIPQGGGSPSSGHRCAGERITMLAMMLALRCLTRDMTYQLVPGQRLDLDLTRMPTRPHSGVLIQHVRATPEIALEPARASQSAYRDFPNASNARP